MYMLDIEVDADAKDVEGPTGVGERLGMLLSGDVDRCRGAQQLIREKGRKERPERKVSECYNYRVKEKTQKEENAQVIPSQDETTQPRCCVWLARRLNLRRQDRSGNFPR